MNTKPIEWWLAELSESGCVEKLKDGPHDNQVGANRAYYIYQRLGFIKPSKKYAVIRCERHEPVPEKDGVDEDSLELLNSIGV